MPHNLPDGYWTTVRENFVDGLGSAANFAWHAPAMAKDTLSAVFSLAADPMWNMPVTFIGTGMAFVLGYTASKPIARAVLARAGAGDGFIASTVQASIALGIIAATTFGAYTALDSMDAPDRPHPPVTIIEPDNFRSPATPSVGTGGVDAPDAVAPRVLPPRLGF